jgi:hypothetical protein
MMDNHGKNDLSLVNNRNVLPFITRSQRLAEDLMRLYKMNESILDAFKRGQVQRTVYVHFNKIFQAESTEQDKEVIFDLLKQGQLVYHILLAFDMQGKQMTLDSVFPSYEFDKLVSKICYLCVPLDLYEEALAEGDFEGDTRQETIQNYIDDIILEARQGILRAYVTNDAQETFIFSRVEVTVLMGHLVLVT